jgi:RimJ/RimL family protein N-acetyltransferase
MRDVTAVHEWATDPEVCRYMPWGPNTLEQTEALLRQAVTGQAEHPRRTFEFGFEERTTGRLVGGGGTRIQSTEHGVTDIGYTLHRGLWGQGYATEAGRALVEFALDTLGMHRVWATCHVDNLRSARVLEKLGMQREGRLRENVRKNGVWRDSWLYALIKGDSAIERVVVPR